MLRARTVVRCCGLERRKEIPTKSNPLSKKGEPHGVNELVKSFDGIADMMKKMSSLGIVDRM